MSIISVNQSPSVVKSYSYIAHPNLKTDSFFLMFMCFMFRALLHHGSSKILAKHVRISIVMD